ncbi:MAG: hypothetical protein SAJ37_13685, partial [Oscillatoria sp. PMC 1068.18]|nr:hypothetical protein [Oscillatoria sp. PMC 1068.18]
MGDSGLGGLVIWDWGIGGVGGIGSVGSVGSIGSVGSVGSVGSIVNKQRWFYQHLLSRVPRVP